MRPQQQNRRMRGRNNNNNNNRKSPNPLTRSYESNGPDVKIRGSAQQIAEKYTTLARDAQSAGDRVMAENYLQHAEHYNRIIAAAQGQMPVNVNRDDDDDSDEDRDEQQAQNSQGGEQRREQPVNGTGPQPVIEGVPAEVALEQEQIARSDKRPNGNGQHAEGEDTQESGDQPPRRSRRPRRPRNRDEQRADGSEAGEQGGGQPKGEAPQVAEPAPVEG